jgi:hypothetical protein
MIPLKFILANRHIGQSGACPICDQSVEDMSRLLFQCPATVNMWECLGLLPIINSAIQIDRASSAVLEFLLWEPAMAMPGVALIQLKEVISIM